MAEIDIYNIEVKGHAHLNVVDGGEYYTIVAGVRNKFRKTVTMKEPTLQELANGLRALADSIEKEGV